MRSSRALIAAAASRALSPLYARLLRMRGVQIGSSVKFRGLPIIERAAGSHIQVGQGVTLVSSNALSVLTTGPCVIRTKAPGAEIMIGKDAGLTGVSLICRARIVVGARVLIGTGTILSDNSAHPIDRVPRRFDPPPVPSPSDAIIIEDDVFIGAHCVVLPGVVIGAGSVVGANSVVTRSVPRGVVAAGSPARVVRELRLSE